MVLDGLTLTVIEGAVPLKTVPSDRVPLIVPGPVTEIFKLADDPLQMLADPLRVPVARAGCALTVTEVIDETHPLLFFAVRL